MLDAREAAGRSALMAVVLALALGGCASLEGYPKDPENTSATMTNLKPAFDGTDEAAYYKAASDDGTRTPLRDAIVTSRLRGYDIEFSGFERELLGYSNSLNVGSDLVGLALGGLTSTVGNAGTKAALGAATTGVLGANSAIDKDLYYQKTIPALIAQMEANRSKALLVIIQGLKLPNSQYPLEAALNDLDAYRDAGSIPDAVASITQSAANAQQAANKAITFARTGVDLTELPSAEAIEAKLRLLSPVQLLAVMKAMQPDLTSRPTTIQQMVASIDPNSEAENGNAAKAKQVLMAWVSEEAMTAGNAAQWTSAITAATSQ